MHALIKGEWANIALINGVLANGVWVIFGWVNSGRMRNASTTMATPKVAGHVKIGYYNSGHVKDCNMFSSVLLLLG